jgi:ribonuclease T1
VGQRLPKLLEAIFDRSAMHGVHWRPVLYQFGQIFEDVGEQHVRDMDVDGLARRPMMLELQDEGSIGGFDRVTAFVLEHADKGLIRIVEGDLGPGDDGFHGGGIPVVAISYAGRQTLRWPWHRSRRLLFFLALGCVAAWFGLALAATTAPAPAAAQTTLEQVARKFGIADIDGFVATVEAIATTGRLPSRYASKGEAERLGWRPGTDLCRVAPGRIIGGDRFGNREGRLPSKPGRRWTEADLDYACGTRGPKRLVFSNDGLIYVTVDHYQSFHPVPQ